MDFSLRRWLRICFLNLLIVALIGVTLRYKIAFSLPFVDQKHLLHGHSHFAFGGWITQVLMVLMVNRFSGKDPSAFRRYHGLLMGNLLTAYGMLLSFPLQGYGWASIFFSTASIFVSWIFAVTYLADQSRQEPRAAAGNWFRAALVFNVLSSLGAFFLAGMMAGKIVHANWYLAAQYYFLHFQYNGWFFFAAMGLFICRMENLLTNRRPLGRIFWLFATACVPAYFLSALWMPIPVWVYVLVILAALAQGVAWVQFVQLIRRNSAIYKILFAPLSRRLLGLSAIALSVKLLLQLGSTHPALSQLAFGFRPIVIGYLHLVLLGVITLFLIGYALAAANWMISRRIRIACWIFVAGIVINEVLLMAQGIAGFGYIAIPHADHWLLGAALIMCSGVLLLNLAAGAERKNEAAGAKMR
ncbi:MAG: hypothetical protein U0X40_10470 [Ferruginibacter sp.]